MNYINDTIMKEILNSNPNFNKIAYKNNIIELDTKQINLQNFNLVEIFAPYKELSEDIKKETMTAEDFFAILELNVNIRDSITPMNNSKNKINVMSVIDYQNVIEKDSLSPIDEQELENFEQFIRSLYEYRDYLADDGINFLSQYENYITSLIIKNEQTLKEEQAIAKYEELASIKKKSEEINEKYIHKLELDAKRERNKERAGYANSILIVEIVVIAAITLSAFIFLYLLK